MCIFCTYETATITHLTVARHGILRLLVYYYHYYGNVQPNKKATREKKIHFPSIGSTPTPTPTPTPPPTTTTTSTPYGNFLGRICAQEANRIL